MPVPSAVGTAFAYASTSAGASRDIAIDTGSSGVNRVTVVGALFETLTDMTIASMAIGAAGGQLVWRRSNGSETAALWVIPDPPQGAQTLTVSWTANSQDVVILGQTFQDVNVLDMFETPSDPANTLTGKTDPAGADVTLDLTTVNPDSLIVTAGVMDAGGDPGTFGPAASNTLIIQDAAVDIGNQARGCKGF